MRLTALAAARAARVALLVAPLVAPAAMALLIPTGAAADVAAAVNQHYLPRLTIFARASAALADAAAADCRPEAVKPAWNEAFDAWMNIGGQGLGPGEAAAPSIAFWPDARGYTPRTIGQMIASQDAIVDTPEDYDEVSVAARGFFALEMMLYDPAFDGYGRGDYSCRLVTTMAADLAVQAQGLLDAWDEDFAPLLLQPGAPGNATYLDEGEALRAIYTALFAALEFNEYQRLDLPHQNGGKPRRVEAWRSGRSLRQVLLASRANLDLAEKLAGARLPEMRAAMAEINAMAARIDDPAFQDIEDPQQRLKMEILWQDALALRHGLENEIGAAYGIAQGFNAADGD